MPTMMFFSQLYVVLPLFLLTLFLFKWLITASWPAKPRKSVRPPPSPPSLPVIGNLHQLGRLPHRSLQALSNKYGPVMLLCRGSKPTVVISSVDGSREIMKTQDSIFATRPKSIIADKIFFGSKDVAFAPYGEYWRQVRSICMLHLLSNKRVQSYKRIREEETSRVIQNISVSPKPAVINLSEMFVRMTYDIICRVALGRKCDHASEFKELLEAMTELVGTTHLGDYVPWLGWVSKINGLDAKVGRVAREFDRFLDGVVEEHKSKKKGDDGGLDFVDILLEFQQENKTGFRLEDDAVKALVMDMFAAGTDTTDTLLEWTMSELLRHPKIMKKLQNELRNAAKGKPQITEDDLEEATYLKAVLKESSRLHVPVPLLVAREAMQDTVVLGYDIAAGTHILVNAWAIARDPSIWKNPEEFWPERFIENNTVDLKGFNFELTPFGAGRRGCPGATFALAVDELALAKVVHGFNFELLDGKKAEDLDMSETAGVTTHRKNPLLVMATPCS